MISFHLRAFALAAPNNQNLFPPEVSLASSHKYNFYLDVRSSEKSSDKLSQLSSPTYTFRSEELEERLECPLRGATRSGSGTAASREKVKTNVYLTNYIKTDNHTVKLPLATYRSHLK